jgi:hypothetical protein
MKARGVPAPILESDAKSVLADLLLSRVLEPARSVGLELVPTAPTVLPVRREVCWTDSGAWLLVDPWNDPTSRNEDRKIPIPRDAHTRLSTLADAGVEPDLIWLGHQLPSTWKDGDPIPDLVPVPAHLRRIDEMLLAPVHAAKELADSIEIAGRGLPGAVAAIAEVVEFELDPVVLGGVTHPALPVVQWAVLAAWTWD